ncbi:hypothetical protein O6H91_17G001000 [Diphasiastrum complanatum]|uniref:Uncharacterized protein n=1 Tax=Diphasiastrum complanatum TaxID=34168 RepID=A0ACC2B3H0_DIPCM|nr:hypothetical protein O6H91_Y200800 [Diphasiastrum complanatum]KAJ7524333.1 hypothetical protein O6H91_17G001000 [Diphasiastrum complanatum]
MLICSVPIGVLPQDPLAAPRSLAGTLLPSLLPSQSLICSVVCPLLLLIANYPFFAPYCPSPSALLPEFYFLASYAYCLHICPRLLPDMCSPLLLGIVPFI